MKIVVLDGHALNPGDLSWSSIASLGELEVYSRTPSELVLERAFDADILIVNKVVLDKNNLPQLKNLKYIGLMSTGFNTIDLEYAKQHNIIVTNIPSYSTYSVAQMTFALILEICIGVGLHSTSTKQGEWADCKDFCYWKQDITELFGKTIGLIGYGETGKRVALIAKAMGMNVLASSPRFLQCDGVANPCNLNTLFKDSDIISLHCPLNATSKHIINKDSLKMCKDGVIIINTARGGCVCEQSLANALQSKKVRAYGADVLECEPPDHDNVLINDSNTYITPHIAWASKQARARLMVIASENLIAFLSGKVQNCVYKL